MNSSDPKVRDDYSVCLKVSGLDSQRDFKFVCFDENPWKMDQFFFDTCQTTKSFDKDLKKLSIPAYEDVPQENEEEFDFF